MFINEGQIHAILISILLSIIIILKRVKKLFAQVDHCRKVRLKCTIIYLVTTASVVIITIPFGNPDTHIRYETRF